MLAGGRLTPCADVFAISTPAIQWLVLWVVPKMRSPVGQKYDGWSYHRRTRLHWANINHQTSGNRMVGALRHTSKYELGARTYTTCSTAVFFVPRRDRDIVAQD